MGNKILHCGDNLEYLRSLADDSVDAVITDPPYGLKFMSKRWDYSVPGVEIWKEVFRVLKPGGHLLSFAGTRTHHRMVVNIEDAGFDIRDMIAWVYGSGFPKSLNVSKAIDKAAGAERRVVGRNPHARPIDGNGSGYSGPTSHDPFITAPATEDAARWDGWGTALKPAFEPITVARKPFKGTVAANVLTHGTAGINIDACRIVTEDNTLRPNGPSGIASPGKVVEFGGGHGGGRFPANFIHDGSPEVTSLFPGEGEASKDRFFYCSKATKKERTSNGKVENSHPTVKPIDLMRYLCRLVTSPNGVVLDPFMGSGSTGVAALLEGFRFIGCEIDEDYFHIATQRIAYPSELKAIGDFF